MIIVENQFILSEILYTYHAIINNIDIIYLYKNHFTSIISFLIHFLVLTDLNAHIFQS